MALQRFGELGGVRAGKVFFVCKRIE